MRSVHGIEHYEGPTILGDDLKYSEDCTPEISEVTYTILNQCVSIYAVIFKRYVVIKRISTKHAFRTLVKTESSFGTDLIVVLALWPVSGIEGLFGQSTSVVNSAIELLQTQNAKKYEYKAEENDDVSELRNGVD